MRKKLFLLFKTLLLLIIFIWIIKSVNIHETLNLLKKTNLFLFFAALIIHNVSNIFLTVKWQRLAVPLGIKSTFLDLLKLNYISIFYSIFVPGQASGELIKGIKLGRRESSQQKVWIPILIDKITNTFIVFLIGLIAVLSDNVFRKHTNIIFTISFVTILLGLLIITLFTEHTARLVNYITDRTLKLLQLFKININQLKDLSLSYHHNYKKHDLLIFETLFWSCLIKIPHIFAFYFLAKSLYLNMNLIESAWLFAIVSITSLLPISFSGLGVREGIVIVLLSKIGIDSSSALSLSMLIFTTGILTGLIGGVIEFASIFQKEQKTNVK